jgi:hypothetical protein
MVAPNLLNAAAAGLKTNCNGGSYRNGVSYDILEKLKVVDTYQELLKARNGFGQRHCERLLAIEAHVYYSCIKNVLDELIQVFLIHS